MAGTIRPYQRMSSVRSSFGYDPDPTCCGIGSRNEREREAAVRLIEDDRLMEVQKMHSRVKRYQQMRFNFKKALYRYEQAKRNSFYRELIRYLIFIMALNVTLWNLPVHFPYEQNAALRDLFYDEEFVNMTFKKNFDDVMTYQEMWQWVQGPLLNGFYDNPLPHMRRVTNIQVRTLRVRGQPCSSYSSSEDVPGLFEDEVCFPAFEKNVEDTEPYGEPDGPDGIIYSWKNGYSELLGSLTFTPSKFNQGKSYGTGGYVVHLPRDNRTAAEALVSQMMEDYVEAQNRIFAVAFTLYNPSSDLFTVFQTLFEFSQTDYFEKTVRLRTVRLLRAVKGWNLLHVHWITALLTVCILYFTYREVEEIALVGVSSYGKSLWNILECAQVGLLLILEYLWIQYWANSIAMWDRLRSILSSEGCSSAAVDQDKAADCFLDLQPLAWHLETLNNVAAVLSLTSVFIIFKYLRLNSRLNLLWRTLRIAWPDVFAFLVIFFLVFWGYSVMGFLSFGHQSRGYHSLSSALTSCFQMLVGAFEYDDLKEASPRLSSLFFVSFMVFVFMILTNMFIAIITEYYSLAQEEKAENDRQRQLVQQREKDSLAERDLLTGDVWTGQDVEYDVLAQMREYLKNLDLRVKLVPRGWELSEQLQVGENGEKANGKKEKNKLSPQTIDLYDGMEVFLIDARYLLEERLRLRHKLKAAVRVVAICNAFCGAFIKSLKKRKYPIHAAHTLTSGLLRVTMTPSGDRTAGDGARGPKSYNTFNHDEEDAASASRRLRASSSSQDYVHSIYLPVFSLSEKAVGIVASLRRNMEIVIDDGNLLRIRLIVLGDQQSGQWPGEERERGFRHRQRGLGDGAHIRRCRVEVDHEATLMGGEKCIVPLRAWIFYYIASYFWETVSWFSQCGNFACRRRLRTRLLNDADIEDLLRTHFSDTDKENGADRGGASHMCRFDELIREIRMFILKKAHKRQWKIDNLEEKVQEEAVYLVERFPDALSRMDKGELIWEKYKPKPLDTMDIKLPPHVILLSEFLAQNAHEVWAQGKVAQGWRFGKQRDNERKLHPDLIPYNLLTEETKQYDRDTSIEALKVIQSLGYFLRKEDDFDSRIWHFGEPVEGEGTYTPRPVNTDDVVIPPQLRELVEMLAQNTHETWAHKRMEQGWKYGPTQDDEKKLHNYLVPYSFLPPTEQTMNRSTATETVKLILYAGFKFQRREERDSYRRMSSGLGKSTRLFSGGSREDKTLGRTVDAAMGARHAADVFLRRGTFSSDSPSAHPNKRIETVMEGKETEETSSHKAE